MGRENGAPTSLQEVRGGFLAVSAPQSPHRRSLFDVSLSLGKFVQLLDGGGWGGRQVLMVGA